MNRFVIWMSATAVLALAASPLAAQTDTTFTYQGSLNEQGVPANGVFNLDFALFDALSGGNQIDSSVMFNQLPVSEGLFTVELDFGANAFDNTSRWLEIAVNENTLSPRQPMTRSPYSIQTRGIFVDALGNVGIGTSTPVYPLHVESNDTPIFGLASGSTGSTYGGYFRSFSSSGRGVYGQASASTGLTDGVFGLSNSTSGRGICGFAPASSGTTHGVFGTSDSTSGRGVTGEARAITGTTYGVYGTIASTLGAGVFGEATATSGGTYGGRFKSTSTFGTGVYGLADSPNGTTRGVWGVSESTTGRGVYGIAVATSGANYGVFGLSHSTSGRGVRGHANATSGVNYGGEFKSDSTTGRGVYGEANASSGVNYGGNFRSFSTSGRGLYGEAVANSGVNYGVYGRSNSPNGFDFFAAGAGANYGAASSRRWKHNVEPISDPLDKLAKLRGVYYDWDEEHGGEHDVGMIAEEVGEVLPEIVNYEENGIDAIGMDYSKMTPLLVEAVNALRSQRDSDIASLHAENEILRDENAALSDRLDSLERIVQQLATEMKEASK